MHYNSGRSFITFAVYAHNDHIKNTHAHQSAPACFALVTGLHVNTGAKYIYLKVLLIYYKIDTTICTQKTRLLELFTCENIQSTYVNSAHNYFC